VERRLPQLDHVMFLRLVGPAKQQQLPVRKEREPVAHDPFLDPLGDQPVGHQHVLPRLPAVKHVERILPVGRVHHPLEDHPPLAPVKLFQLAGRQVIAVRKDQPVTLGQQGAGLPDGIHPHRRLGFLVEDEITRQRFLVGPDLEQDQCPTAA
jgi:hypothetical protein